MSVSESGKEYAPGTGMPGPGSEASNPSAPAVAAGSKYSGPTAGVPRDNYDHNRGPSIDFIYTQWQYLRLLYSTRNREYDVLRRIFDGDFASVQEDKAAPTKLFNDRIKIVYNIANATVRRYMDSLSAPPRLEATPNGFDEKALELADAKSHWLNYIYDCNNMSTQLMMAAYYQSLLDRAIWHVRPMPDTKHKISIELIIPDNFMPMPVTDSWGHWPYLIYSFRYFEPKDITIDPLKSVPNLLFHNVIEFWDRNWFIRIERGVEVCRIKHDFGDLAFTIAHNIPIPHRYRGQGDVDQAIGLNEYLNMLFSDEADIINYAANPITVIRGSKAGATNLPFAPRAVWELERDGQAGFLQWAGSAPTVEAQILRTIQAIEDATGVSSPAFGREIPSGTSGNAVRSLLAGFNTRLGTKQQLLGESLAKANKLAMLMATRLFPNTEYEIIGERPVINRGKNEFRRVGYHIKPSDFGDTWFENQVIFDPIDPSQRFFQELEKKKEGLQSRYTTMRNMGIENISDEVRRMRDERTEDATHENAMALGRQGQLPLPATPGHSPAAPAGAAPLALPPGDPLAQAFDQGGPDALKALFGGHTDAHGIKKPGPSKKQRELPDQAAEQGPVSSASSPTPATSTPDLDKKIGVDDIMQALRHGPSLNGEAVLTGAVAKQGFTADMIDFIIKDPSDESRIKQALGSLASRAKFTVTSGPILGADLIPLHPMGGPIPGQFDSVKKKVVPSSQAALSVKVDAFINAIVIQIEKTNNAAEVYTVAVLDDKGRVVPIAKTFPQRQVKAEQGELVSVHITGLSRRRNSSEGGWRYSLVQPELRANAPHAAKPTTLKTIEAMFEKAQEVAH